MTEENVRRSYADDKCFRIGVFPGIIKNKWPEKKEEICEYNKRF